MTIEKTHVKTQFNHLLWLVHTPNPRLYTYICDQISDIKTHKPGSHGCNFILMGNFLKTWEPESHSLTRRRFEETHFMRMHPFLQNTVAADATAKQLIYGSSHWGSILLSEKKNTNPKNIVLPLENHEDVHRVPVFTICSSNFDPNTYLKSRAEPSLSQSDQRACFRCTSFAC